MNVEIKNINVGNLKSDLCQICLKKVHKFTLLKCVTCEKFGILSVMCVRCKRNHCLTNTHKGIFVSAYPEEVLTL